MEKILLKGAVTELVATFDKDEKLDLKMYADECDFQLKAGIKGLFVGGFAGESLTTTREERIEMTKVAVAHAGGKIPVVGNIAEMRLTDAMALLKGYVDAGVDAICVTQPYVLGYTPNMLFKFFSTLAAATKLPVYIYNAPQTNNILESKIVYHIDGKRLQPENVVKRKFL